VRPLDPESAEGGRIVEYVRSLCASEDLPVEIEAANGNLLGRYRTATVTPSAEA
jgi:hypothetical protein